MSRPVLAAVEAQQKTIEAQASKIAGLESFTAAARSEIIVLKSVLHALCQEAGFGMQAEAIRKKADMNNPSQPFPDPPSEAPSETTEQALQAETNDDVQNPGMTPGSVQDLAADTTTTPLVPGETLPAAPFGNMQNVQAPVAGTETQRPLNETKIETDVRVGDPMNQEVAFPWTLSSHRTFAAMRLARLRIAAGLATGDDLGLGETIASDRSLTDAAIAQEVDTLSKVQVAAARQRPASLVPRAAAVQRTVPSLTSEGLSGSAISDLDASDLFD